MSSLRKYFQTCLDLPDVVGAFCLAEDGRLIEQFMPAPYNDAIFEEAGRRILNLLDAVESSYKQSNEFLLTFDSNALYLKRSDGVVIGLLTNEEPLMPSLRVSTNLLLKQSGSILVKTPAKNFSSDQPAQDQPSNSLDSDIADLNNDTVELEEEVVITPKKTQFSHSTEPTEKRGLFGRKRKKASSGRGDIWG
jgi:hypothetical protein